MIFASAKVKAMTTVVMRVEATDMVSARVKLPQIIKKIRTTMTVAKAAMTVTANLTIMVAMPMVIRAKAAIICE